MAFQIRLPFNGLAVVRGSASQVAYGFFRNAAIEVGYRIDRIVFDDCGVGRSRAVIVLFELLRIAAKESGVRPKKLVFTVRWGRSAIKWFTIIF